LVYQVAVERLVPLGVSVCVGAPRGEGGGFLVFGFVDFLCFGWVRVYCLLVSCFLRRVRARVAPRVAMMAARRKAGVKVPVASLM